MLVYESSSNKVRAKPWDYIGQSCPFKVTLRVHFGQLGTVVSLLSFFMVRCCS